MDGIRLLVFNVNISGMNKFLLTHLQKKGHGLIVTNSPIPKRYKYWSLLKTFHFNRDVWYEKFDLAYWGYYKHPDVFDWRTAANERILKKYHDRYDAILQFHTLFAPARGRSDKPYFVFTSWTCRLSDREWPEWEPIKDPDTLARWDERERDLYRNAQAIFVTNRYVIHSLVDDYGIDPAKVIYVGYGPPLSTTPDFVKIYDGRTILYVGYQFERKGGRCLLQAFKKVRQEVMDARLIIIGPSRIDGPDCDGIDFRGIVRDRTKLIEAYKEACVFTMPSLCEPFGLTFLEAMSYKLPCVGTTVDAMREIIQDGVTGYTVPPADPDRLAEKLIFLLKNRDHAETMGANGYHRLIDVFSWDKVVDIMDRELLTVKAGSRP